MSASEAVRAVLAAIDNAKPALDVIDDCERKADAAKKALRDVEHELANAQARMESLAEHLRTAEENHQARLKEIEAEGMAAAQEHNRNLAAQQQELERVTLAVGEKQKEMNATLAGLAVIGQRLAGAERLAVGGAER